MIKDCKMRHENGNCLPAGGFCTANTNICEALQNAYNHGYFEGIQKGFEKGGEQKWIPCSERLPEVRQWVLCQCRAGIMDVLRLTADGSWDKNYPHTEYMSGFVVAWMPLPKPYEGEC